MTNETTASQPKSIGDDAQFVALLDWCLEAHISGVSLNDRKRFDAGIEEFIAYIDSRAPAARASATIQAAPTDEQIMRIAGDLKQRNAGVWPGEVKFARAVLCAATIQQPVMVAEPVGAMREALDLAATWIENIKPEELELWREVKVADIRRVLRAAPMVADPAGVALTVWCGAMPESNGKSNFTALLMRKGGDMVDGITLDRSEYPDRVRYEADRVRYLLGELNEAPFILDYDADKHSGYMPPAATVKAVPSEALTGAARDVLDERQRQVEREGWTPEHDDTHNDGSMAQAAACYAYPELVTVLPGLNAWPWAEAWFKVRDPRRNYVRAAALLLAEIERIDRAAPLADKTGGGDHG